MDKIAIISTALNEQGISPEACVALETDLHEAVSMTLADSLRLLLEHGLLEGGDPVMWEGGCVPAWKRHNKVGAVTGECAAWKVLRHYYDLKVSHMTSCDLIWTPSMNPMIPFPLTERKEI